ARLKRRVDHARASRAVAGDGTRPPSSRRTDESSRSRIASMVPGISANLSWSDCHDLARSRVFKSAGRLHRRDRALETGALSRQLGQLRRAESSARRTTARRLQKSAERNRVTAIVCRSISRQGKQSIASTEQAETDRPHEKNRGPGRARKDDQVPFPTTGTQWPARDHVERRRSCLWRPRCLSRNAIPCGARSTHRACRPEWRREIDSSQVARWGVARAAWRPRV